MMESCWSYRDWGPKSKTLIPTLVLSLLVFWLWNRYSLNLMAFATFFIFLMQQLSAVAFSFSFLYAVAFGHHFTSVHCDQKVVARPTTRLWGHASPSSCGCDVVTMRLCGLVVKIDDHETVWLAIKVKFFEIFLSQKPYLKKIIS